MLASCSICKAKFDVVDIAEEVGCATAITRKGRKGAYADTTRSWELGGLFKGREERTQEEKEAIPQVKEENFNIQKNH